MINVLYLQQERPQCAYVCMKHARALQSPLSIEALQNPLSKGASQSL